MEGVDVLLILGLLVYVFLRTVRGTAGPKEGRRPPPGTGRGPAGPGAEAAERESLLDTLRRWAEEQERVAEERRRAAEERQREAERRQGMEPRPLEPPEAEPPSREAEEWLLDAEAPIPDAGAPGAVPAALTSTPESRPEPALVHALEPPTVARPSARLTGTPLAALERLPPLQRAILYAEIVGPPRGSRLDEASAIAREP